MEVKKYICGWKRVATNQRETEVSRGEGLLGTIGFEYKGCYKCDGHNEDCPAYVELKRTQSD